MGITTVAILSLDLQGVLTRITVVTTSVMAMQISLALFIWGVRVHMGTQTRRNSVVTYISSEYVAIRNVVPAAQLSSVACKSS